MATYSSYAQNWEVLTLKNCYSIEPPSYASAAYVVASYGPRFFSTVRFVKIRATCEKFLGKWFTAPPGKKFPLRLFMSALETLRNSDGPSLVPWDTPSGTGPHSEKQSPDNLTRCCLCVKKSATQKATARGIGRPKPLRTSRVWSLRSKAFLQSNRTTLTAAQGL